MEPKQTFLGQFMQRLSTETPKFFRKILNVSLILAAVGAAILAIDATNLPVPIPQVVNDISGYLVTAGVVAAAISKATTTNPTLQEAGGSLARTPRKEAV